MLRKTFIAFHALNVLLQQQYRECRFIKYSELFSCLLVSEQNNELLMKNHQSCPTRFESFPKVSATSFQNYGHRCFLFMVIVVVMEEILNIMLMIILLRIHKKGKPHFITRRETNLRKKMKKIYIVNPPRLEKRLVIDVE